MFENVKVKLEPVKHQYFHTENGTQFKSVSKLLDSFKTPFDADFMSVMCAKKELRLRGITDPSREQVAKEADLLRITWKSKNTFACNVGTRIHDALELFGKTTRIQDESLEPAIRAIYHLFRDYKKSYLEQALHSEFYECAGTADRIDIRPGTTNVVDISDYKTNISHGIQFSDKYKKYLKYPLDYLEDVNFVHYTLQLSIYMLMCETDFGCKPGKMQLIYIPPDNPLAFRVIPIMYMRAAAHMILKSNLDETVFDRHVQEMMV